MTDRIHEEMLLAAPRSRVWRALTDSAEFGRWFGVRLEEPFRAGERITGAITNPGYEHLTLRADVVTVEPELRFAFRWQPHAVDPDRDYAGDPSTLVDFRLEDAGTGTRLTVTESGFDSLPDGERAAAYARNARGWALQMQNIREYVDG